MQTTGHDNHQYYFERYLRNKLTDEERKILDEKFASDEQLRKDFELYKQHRKTFLKELLVDRDRKPKKSRLLNLFYLMITIGGIVVATNFYFENKALKEERKRDQSLISRLVENIPFIGGRNKKDTPKKEEVKKSNKSRISSIEENEAEEQDSTLTEETVLFDTVLIPLKRSFFEERVNYYLSEVDSTLNVEEIIQVLVKNHDKYDIKQKASPVAVQVVFSKLENRYKFDGNILTIQTSNKLKLPFLIKDQGELIWMNLNSELVLTADDNWHYID